MSEYYEFMFLSNVGVWIVFATIIFVTLWNLAGKLVRSNMQIKPIKMSATTNTLQKLNRLTRLNVISMEEKRILLSFERAEKERRKDYYNHLNRFSQRY
jgi:hypothetical protein